MRKAFLALPSITLAVIDPEEQALELTLPDGQTLTSFPDNLHRILQGEETDASRRQALDDWIAGALETLEAEPEPYSAEVILPVLRPSGFANGIGEAEQPISRPFAAGLELFYVFDLPRTLVYVDHEEAEALELDAEAVHDQALANLTARDWPLQIDGAGPYMLILDGTFEASMLLLPDLWDQIEQQVGPVVVMPLARDLVLFAPKEDPELISALIGIAAEHFGQAAYSLIDRPIVRTAQGWVDF